MHSAENDSRRLSLTPPTAPQPIHYPSRRRNTSSHSPSAFKVAPPLFLPSEDEGDKKVCALIRLNKINAGGWLLNSFRAPPLNSAQFTALCHKIYKPMLLEKFGGYLFTVNNVLKNSTDYVHFAQVARHALCYYVGGGCKKDVLGVDYLKNFLAVLSDNELTEIDAGICQELSLAARDDDFQVVLQEISPGVGLLEEMVNNTIVFFAQQTGAHCDSIFEGGLTNRAVLPDFSLISWNNEHARNFDLVFTTPESGASFLESEIRIPLNPFTYLMLPDPDTYGVPQNFYFHVFLEGHRGEEASQGLLDCLTGVLHFRDIEKMNEYTWPMMIAYLSKGRRFYEPGCQKKVTNKVVGKEFESIIGLISKHLDQHYPDEILMKFAMTCNACLTLQPFFSSEVIKSFWHTLLPKQSYPKDDFSVFSLIAIGISEVDLPFDQVMQIHQLFAFLSLSVKKPTFNYPREIFLTKHDGEPAIKILEGNTILLPFKLVESYHTFLTLFEGKRTFKLMGYLTKVFEAYLPTNAFNAKHGSQLSPYKAQLASQIAPLHNLLKEKGISHKHSFVRSVSYYLMLGCQTSHPTGFEYTLENLPIIMKQIVPQQHLLLLETIENVLIHSAMIPWAGNSSAIFGRFREYLNEDKDPLVAWMKTLASSSHSTVRQISIKLWEKTHVTTKVSDGNFSSQLIYLVAQTDISKAIEMFNKAMPLTNLSVSSQYNLFLYLAKRLQSFDKLLLKETYALFSSAPIFLNNPDFIKSITQEAFIASHSTFMWYMRLLIDRKEFAYARSLLVTLTTLKIFTNESQEAVGAWLICFQNVLEASPLPLAAGVSMWKKGKKFKIWSSPYYPMHQFLNILVFLEKLYASDQRSEGLRKKILVDLCQHSNGLQELPRIRILILKHLVNQSVSSQKLELPESFIPFLLQQDQFLIQLNSLEYEIEKENFSECLTLIGQLLNGNFEHYTSKIEELISQVLKALAVHEKGKPLDLVLPLINSIYENPNFLTFFPIKGNLASHWLCEVVKMCKLEQSSSIVQESIAILMQRVFTTEALEEKLNEAGYCLDFLLLEDQMPSVFKPHFTLQRGLMFQACVLLSDHDRLKKLISYFIANNGYGRLNKSVLDKYVEVSAELLAQPVLNPSVVSALHSMWKDISTKKKENVEEPKDYLCVIETLLIKLIQNQQMPFVLYWSELSVSPSPKIIGLLVQLGMDLAHDQTHHALAILETFYKQNWSLEDGSKAWIQLAEQFLHHQFHSIVYLFAERKEKVVLPGLKAQIPNLLQPLFDSSCQNFEDLNFYTLMLEHGNIKDPSYWMDLLEKALGFNQANLSGRILEKFDDKILKGNAWHADPMAKAYCLELGARLLGKVKSTFIKKWLDASPFSSLAGSLPIQHQSFNTHLLSAALSQIPKKEILEKMSQNSKEAPSALWIELWIHLSLKKDAGQAKDAIAILEMFYKKQWLWHDGSKAWIHLVGQLVEHQFSTIVYRFTIRKEKTVLPLLKEHVKKLMEPLVDSDCQNKEELNTFLRLINPLELTDYFYWMDLLEKTLVFGDKDFSIQVLETFNKNIVKRKDLGNDLFTKASCLIMCARILCEVKSPLLHEWLKFPPLEFFTDPSLAIQKQHFCTYLLEAILTHKIGNVELLTNLEQLRLLCLTVGDKLADTIAIKVGEEMVLSLDMVLMTDGCKLFSKALKSNNGFEFLQKCENLLYQLLSLIDKNKKLKQASLIEAAAAFVESVWESRKDIPFKLLEACAAHSQEAFVFKAYGFLLDLFSTEIKNSHAGLFFYKFLLQGLNSKSRSVQQISAKIIQHEKASYFLEEHYELLLIKLSLNEFLLESIQGEISSVHIFIDKFESLELFPEDKKAYLALALKIIITNYARTAKAKNFNLYINKIFGIWITNSSTKPTKWNIESCGTHLVPTLLFFADSDSEALELLKKVIPETSLPDFTDEVISSRCFVFLETMLHAFFRAEPHPLYLESINLLLLMLIKNFKILKNEVPDGRELICSLLREFVFYKSTTDWLKHMKRCNDLYEVALHHDIFQKNNPLAVEFYFFLKGTWLSENRKVPFEKKISIVEASIEHRLRFPHKQAIATAIVHFGEHGWILLHKSQECYLSIFRKLFKFAEKYDLLDFIQGSFILEGKLCKMNGQTVRKPQNTKWFIGADGTPDGQKFALKLGFEFFDCLKKFCSEKDPYVFCTKALKFLTAMFSANGFEKHFEEYYIKLRVIGEILMTRMAKKHNGGGVACYFFPALLQQSENELTVQQRFYRIKELDYWMQKLLSPSSPIKFSERERKAIIDTKLSKKISEADSKLKKGEKALPTGALNTLEQKILINLVHLISLSMSTHIPSVHAVSLAGIVQEILIAQGNEALNSHGYSAILTCFQHTKKIISIHAMNTFKQHKFWQYVQKAMIKRSIFYVSSTGNEKGKEVASELCKITFEGFFSYNSIQKDLILLQNVMALESSKEKEESPCPSLKDVFAQAQSLIEKRQIDQLQKEEDPSSSCHQEIRAHMTDMLSFLTICFEAGGFVAKPHYYYDFLRKLLDNFKPNLDLKEDHEIMNIFLDCIYKNLHRSCFEKVQALVTSWISIYARQEKLELGGELLEEAYKKDNYAFASLAGLFRIVNLEKEAK